MRASHDRPGPARNRRRVVITRRFALDVRDGINIFIFGLADALIAAGHDVAVLANRVGDHDRLRSLYAPRSLPALHAIEHRPHRLSIEGLTPGWLTRGRQRIREFHPDLVINNGALPFDTPGVTCNLAHDLGWATAPRRFDRLRTWYKRYAYGRGQEIIALSPEVGDGLTRQLGIDPARVRIIPPTAGYSGRARPLAEREDLIVHTGTGDYKDPASSVRAFAMLPPRATRLVVEGPVTEGLAQQVSALPAVTRARIDLVGELSGPDLDDLLGSARIAAFPSRYTVPTASATVVEAIRAATPIAGSSQLSRLVLQPELNGLASHDDRGLAASFERLLGDDDAWDRMSWGAQEMSPRFEPDRVAAAYLALLDDHGAGP